MGGGVSEGVSGVDGRDLVAPLYEEDFKPYLETLPSLSRLLEREPMRVDPGPILLPSGVVTYTQWFRRSFAADVTRADATEEDRLAAREYAKEMALVGLARDLDLVVEFGETCTPAYPPHRGCMSGRRQQLGIGIELDEDGVVVRVPVSESGRLLVASPLRIEGPWEDNFGNMCESWAGAFAVRWEGADG